LQALEQELEQVKGQAKSALNLASAEHDANSSEKSHLLEQERHEKAELQVKLAALASSLEQERQELAAASDKIATLQDAVGELEKQVALQSESRVVAENKYSGLATHMEALEQKLMDATATAQDLEEKLKEARATTQDLEKQLKDTTATANGLEQKLNEVNGPAQDFSSDRVAALEQQLADKVAELDFAQTTLQLKEMDLEALQDELNSVKASSSNSSTQMAEAVSVRDDKIAELERKLRDQDAPLQSPRSPDKVDRAADEARVREIKDHQIRLETLRDALREQQDSLNEAREQLEITTQELTQREALFDMEKQHFGMREQQLREMEVELQKRTEFLEVQVRKRLVMV
jgi:chromosome segregation ATPase